MQFRRTFIATIMVIATVLCLVLSSHAYEVSGVDIHGFASQGYVRAPRENPWPLADSADGTFQYNDFGFNIAKQFTPDIHMGLQLFSQKRGAYGHDRVDLDWAFIDYRYADWLGARIGKIKMPKGLYNDTRDNDALRTFVFLPQGFYSDAQRESEVALIGGGLYGTANAGSYGSFAYELQVGKLDLYAYGGIANQVKFFGFTNIDNMHSEATTVYSLDWRTPLRGVRLVVGGLYTNLDIYGMSGNTPIFIKFADFDRKNASLEYTKGPFVLAAEYARIDATEEFSGGSADYKPETYYISTTYRFTELFEMGSYYSIFYQNRDHRQDYYAPLGKPDYTSWQKDLAVTARFDINKYTTFKFEEHFLSGSALIDLVDLGTTSKYWRVMAVKLTFSF
jgi:hypothetical protein